MYKPKVDLSDRNREREGTGERREALPGIATLVETLLIPGASITADERKRLQIGDQLAYRIILACYQ